MKKQKSWLSAVFTVLACMELSLNLAVAQNLESNGTLNLDKNSSVENQPENLQKAKELIKFIAANDYAKTKEILDRDPSLISVKLNGSYYVIPAQYLHEKNVVGFKFDDKMFDLLLTYKPNFNHNVIGNDEDFWSILDFISHNSNFDSQKSIEIFDKIVKSGFSVDYYNKHINASNVFSTAVAKPLFFDKLLENGISPRNFLKSSISSLINVEISTRTNFDKTFKQKFSKNDKEKLLDSRGYILLKSEFLHAANKILKNIRLMILAK